MAKLSAKFCQVLVDSYLLSTRANAFTLVTGLDELDVPAFTEGSHNVILGLGMGQASLKGLFDATASGDIQSHNALKAMTSETAIVTTVMVGQGAAVGVGDPAYSLKCKQFTYGINPAVADPILYTMEAKQLGYRGDWGVALTAGVASLTGTASHTGSSVDGTTQSTNGAVGYCHVHTAIAGGDTFSMIIQDSANDATFATLIDFTGLDGSTTGSVRKAVTGTVDRYVRALATRTGTTGGAFKFAYTFARYLANQEAPMS